MEAKLLKQDCENLKSIYGCESVRRLSFYNKKLFVDDICSSVHMINQSKIYASAYFLIILIHAAQHMHMKSGLFFVECFNAYLTTYSSCWI